MRFIRQSSVYTVVETQEEWQEMLDYCVAADIVAYDVETTGLNVRKERIIGISISASAGSAFYLPYLYYDKIANEMRTVPGALPKVNWLLEELQKKKLVMHNASFDIRMTKTNFGVDLLPQLHADTMLLKHTCDEDHPFGLKEIAKSIQHHLGYVEGEQADEERNKLKDHLKAVGAGAKEFYKADYLILGEYAAADADLTMRVYNYYIAELEKQGLQKFFFEDEVMPLYKEVTIPMESCGIPLDMPLLQASKEEIENDIADLSSRIYAEIEPDLVDFYDWYYDRHYPCSRTGDFPKYAAALLGIELPTTKSGAPSLTAKFINELPECIFKDFMLGFSALDPSIVRQVQRKMDGDQHPFNLSSKDHLKRLFFQRLGCIPVSKTDKGNPQVDDEFLESVKSKFSWVSLLLDFNKLNKIKGSYIERFLDEQENGIFYPSFMQHRTISGRYGSDMQQLSRPKEYGKGDSDVVVKHTNNIRKFFISGPGYLFVDSDYQSLEPHVFAHVSGDERLRQIFRTPGQDFYSTIAINTEQLKGVSANQNDDNYLGKVNKQKRQTAKAYSLGIPYGMTGYKLQFELNIPQERAEQLIQDYLRAFPDLTAWMRRSEKACIRDGFIRSEAGRIRHMQRAKDIVRNFADDKELGSDLLNSLHLWKQYNEDPPTYRRMKELRKELVNYLNNAKNFQIQSLAASIVNRAAIQMNRHFKAERIDAIVCCNVHDQLIVRCSEEAAFEVSRIMQTIMENCYSLSVPLKAPPTIGKNMYETH